MLQVHYWYSYFKRLMIALQDHRNMYKVKYIFFIFFY